MEDVTPQQERLAKEIILKEVLEELGHPIPVDGFMGNLPSRVNSKAHICTNARFDYFRRCYKIKKMLNGNL